MDYGKLGGIAQMQENLSIVVSQELRATAALVQETMRSTTALAEERMKGLGSEFIGIQAFLNDKLSSAAQMGEEMDRIRSGMLHGIDLARDKFQSVLDMCSEGAAARGMIGTLRSQMALDQSLLSQVTQQMAQGLESAKSLFDSERLRYESRMDLAARPMTELRSSMGLTEIFASFDSARELPELVRFPAIPLPTLAPSRETCEHHMELSQQIFELSEQVRGMEETLETLSKLVILLCAKIGQGD